MKLVRRARKLSRKNQETLCRLRDRAAESGYEQTPDQTIETFVDIDRRFREGGHGGIIEAIALLRMYDTRPPRPPYDGWFDDRREAEEFAENVRKAYDGIDVVVARTGNKRFEVLERDESYPF